MTSEYANLTDRVDACGCLASRVSTWVVLVTLLIGALVALGADDEVLSDSPNLSRMCELVSGVFPVIQKYAAKSEFPQVTKLYMTCMLAAFPFALVAPLCTLYKDKRFLVPIQESQLGSVPLTKHVVSAIAVVLGFPVLAYFMWYVNPGLNIWFMNFSSSRTSLALFGAFITLAIPFMIGGSITLLIRLLLGAHKILSSD